MGVMNTGAFATLVPTGVAIAGQIHIQAEVTNPTPDAAIVAILVFDAEFNAAVLALYGGDVLTEAVTIEPAVFGSHTFLDLTIDGATATGTVSDDSHTVLYSRSWSVPAGLQDPAAVITPYLQIIDTTSTVESFTITGESPLPPPPPPIIPPVSWSEHFNTDPTGGWDLVSGSAVVQNGAIYAESGDGPGDNGVGDPGAPWWSATAYPGWEQIGHTTGDVGVVFTPGFMAAGPHPILVTINGNEAIYELVRRRGGIDTVVATDIGGVLDAYYRDDIDFADGDEAFFRCTNTNGAFFDNIIHLYGKDRRVGSIYRIPIPTVGVGVRVTVKATFKPGNERDYAPARRSDLFQWLRAGLQLENADASQWAALWTEVSSGDAHTSNIGVYSNIWGGGAGPHGQPVDDGGEWWFTLTTSETLLTAAIWSEAPPAWGGTPAFEISNVGVDVDDVTGTFEFTHLRAYFGNQALYEDRDMPEDYSHYDYIVISTRPDTPPEPGPLEHPDWPYVPPSIAAVAGAPAALRLP